MKTYALVLLLLVIHSAASDAAGPAEPGIDRTLPTAEKYSRPVSEENPFGIDYGFHPLMYLRIPQGVPTHQLSMLNAQIIFAESNCTITPKPTRYQKGFHIIFLLAYDKDFNKPYKFAYAQAVEAIRARYQNAWDGMDESQRSAFCAEYWSDIRYFVETSVSNRVRRLPPASMFYLGALAPLSRESIEEIERKAKAREEREKLIAPIAFLGQALALAGSLSAATDALSAVDSGKLSLSQARLQQSSALQRVAGDFGNTGILALSRPDSQAVPAPTGPVVACQALDHFDQYDADLGSDVWKKYQSLSSDCEALKYLIVE